MLAAAVDLARQAAQEEAGEELVGAHAGVQAEGPDAATHLFHANYPGYRGWHWAVTVATAGPGTPVTVSEVVMLPGPDALIAPEWVPWHERVRAGDLGVGDLLPARPEDPRLVPSYLAADDPEVEEANRELGLGRVHVLSRQGRLTAAERWRDSEFGPNSEMARSAPAHCGTCGFYIPLGGSLRAAFGVCGNELTPADGHVVHVEYGCGAHSEVEVESGPSVPVADLVYDDAILDVEPNEERPEASADQPVARSTEPTPADQRTADENGTDQDSTGPVGTDQDADTEAGNDHVVNGQSVNAQGVNGQSANGQGGDEQNPAWQR
ncbi:DUF3027 domain-containing protein [Goodfellowiella coeruleoviolacea]|uniref:DUF3027 domain-containing protein n=1 Tax=Goodfellowiella coeruleoviolacea TaxID=334858 RepID=UPI0020A3C821|nr:DUF3027 domain-containing protein [Goodfellowiella coeruleoviolacea]